MERKNIDSVIRSLRRVNLQGCLFGQTVAIRFGLTESDVEALEVLLDSGSATAGRLSELMGLTTGAVTRVIDRLEQAGYVRRVPDPTDRRRVIVEIVGEQAAAVESTLDRVSAKNAIEIGKYSEAELAVINDFLTKVADITLEEATALRESPAEGASSASQHTAPLGGLTGRGSSCVRARRDRDQGSRLSRSCIERASMDPSPRSGFEKAPSRSSTRAAGCPGTGASAT